MRAAMLAAAAQLAACSLKRRADVNDDGGTGGCRAACTAMAPVCNGDTCGVCTTEDDCRPFALNGTPHCATSGACVECRDSNDCTSPGSYCDMGTCRMCTMDAQCPSNVCEEHSGKCIDEASVLYVEKGKTGTMCTKAAPCGVLTKALSLVDASHKYVKVEPATYSENVSISGITVTILGRGATLNAAAQGPTINIDNDANATIVDLSIGGASKQGVNCPSSANTQITLLGVTISHNSDVGILAVDGCHVTVDQSLIWANARGGVNIWAAAGYALRNNMIVKNGGPSAGFGGVFLGPPGVFEFNTVADNTITSNLIGGVTCRSAPVLKNNIVYGNTSTGPNKQSDPTCVWEYSDVGPDGVSGSTNMNANPSFNLTSTTDYTLSPQSPLRNAADPSATLTIDYQGEMRPQGAGREPGADEIP